MKQSGPIGSVILALKAWLTPRSSDPTVVYRERALRFLLPAISLLRVIALVNAYFSPVYDQPQRAVPLWFAILIFVVPSFFSFYFLIKKRIGVAGAFLLLNWYLMDMSNLPADGYWHPGFQVSVIMQIILGTLLLPGRAILPFALFQISTIAIWGGWLDMNYYDPPRLSTGEPVSVFSRAIITLAGQEAMIMFIVRYLRLEMERSLGLQQEMIFHLEERVAERTAELEVKNKDLESFSYSVSHDLRAPLRAINGFTSILKEEFADSLPSGAQQYLLKIYNSGIKMGQLIDELLVFSQIGRSQIRKQPTSLNAIVRTVIESLAPETETRQIEWKLAVLPDAQVDAVLIQQVYANLLNNAVKYTRGRNPARIEVGSYVQSNPTVYFVRDNGAGFDMKYVDKLFGVFQRLHREDEFEGTGIGLATVQRIIHGHGGRIWVEAEVDKGATFYFILT